MNNKQLLPDTVNYRGRNYDIFESKGRGFTEFKGKKFKDLREGNYVSINDKLYQVINNLSDFKKIKPEKNKETDIINANSYIYLCEIDLSINRKIKGISHSIFLENFYYDTIEDGDPLLSIAFHSVSFEKDCIITSHTSEEANVTFHRCNFEKKLKIRNTELSKIYVDGKKQYEHYQQHKLKIKELKIIDCTVGNDAYLRIGFLEVENFELSNLRNPQNAELNIGDCYFQCFKLTNFRNIGKFKLFKINILDKEPNKEKTDNLKFQIDNTSIGQADFQGLNLALFDKVVMFDNIFSNIDYTNIQWKNEIEVGQCQDEEKAILEKKQDTYRTLKNVAQKNNDQPQALIFYAKEMEYYGRIVNGNTDYSWFDRATLWFNKYTNNFGLNWWRPLFGLISLSVIFYCLLLCGIENNCNAEHWGNYFVFLNPTHKVEFIGSGWGIWAYGIDFVFRIIEGLLIYQTIQAFRKYSRKL